MSDHTEDEAFLTGPDGQILDGHVVADLEGEAEGGVPLGVAVACLGCTRTCDQIFTGPELCVGAAPIESESDDGEGPSDEQGQEGAGSDHDMEDLQDDSIHTFEGHTCGFPGPSCRLVAQCGGAASQLTTATLLVTPHMELPL